MEENKNVGWEEGDPVTGAEILTEVSCKGL